MTWSGPITVNSETIGNFGINGTYALPNMTSGSGGVTFFASGGATNHVLTVNLSGVGTYTGPTTLNASFGASEPVNLSGGANRPPTTTDLTISDDWNANYVTLNLGGNNQQVNTLTMHDGALATANLTNCSGSPKLNVAGA